MTIYNKSNLAASSNKRNSNADDFTLTGSQISLIPRWSTSRNYGNTAISWSGAIDYRHLPRRSSSAVPTFGAHECDRTLDSSSFERPHSADNILICPEGRILATTRTSSVKDNSNNDVHANILYQNMLNEHAEEKTDVPKTDGRSCADIPAAVEDFAAELQPGLSSKPPLPPLINHDGDSIKSVPDKETFDEIVALKFQQWFPNSTTTASSGSNNSSSSTFGEGNNLLNNNLLNNNKYDHLQRGRRPENDDDHPLEVLSFREHRYQTCEYRYEVSRGRRNNSSKSTTNLLRPKRSSSNSGRFNNKLSVGNSSEKLLFKSRPDGEDKQNSKTKQDNSYQRSNQTNTTTINTTTTNNVVIGKKTILKNSTSRIYPTTTKSVLSSKMTTIRPTESKVDFTRTNTSKPEHLHNHHDEDRDTDHHLRRIIDNSDSLLDEPSNWRASGSLNCKFIGNKRISFQIDHDDGNTLSGERNFAEEEHATVVIDDNENCDGADYRRVVDYDGSDEVDNGTNPDDINDDHHSNNNNNNNSNKNNVNNNKTEVSLDIYGPCRSSRFVNERQNSDDKNNRTKKFVECAPPNKIARNRTWYSNDGNSYRTNFNVNNREKSSKFKDTNFVKSAADSSYRASPPNLLESATDDVLSWMSSHPTNRIPAKSDHTEDCTKKSSGDGSVYNEIVDILKALDTENDENYDVKSKNRDSAYSEQATTDQRSTSAKAIWSLLDEAESGDVTSNPSKETNSVNGCQNGTLKNENPSESVNWNRLSELLNLPSSELAQKVVALQMMLQEREISLQNLQSRHRNAEILLQHQNEEMDINNRKLKEAIAKLKEEKRLADEEFDKAIRQVERKHVETLNKLEEKHQIDMKKMQEKQAVADRIQREKWMEAKTLKIKELTVKSLEPELNKMTTAHHEEMTDLRRFHQRQLHEMEESWSRKMAILKEKLEADKDKAVAIEREMARQKLENEITELEKRYQEQRKRLLAEIHVERENMEREGEAVLAVKEKDVERRWQKKSFEMQKKLEDLQKQHQEEIESLRNNLEMEKQTWIKSQLMELSEKENKIREQCKKERDSHIEMAIQKLDNEVSEKEKAADTKIRKIKEQYEMEIRELENTVDNSRKKSNDSRVQIQNLEEMISEMRIRLHQAETELNVFKERYDRLNKEQFEMQNVAKSEMATKLNILQSELNQSQLLYQSQIKSLKSEHERELSQVYNRVKEMVLKKDDVINNLKKQKDAAVQQCCQLEKLLDQWRKGHIISR